MNVTFWATYERVMAEPDLAVWRVKACRGGPRQGVSHGDAHLTNGRLVGTGSRIRGEACDYADLRYKATHAWEALRVFSEGEWLYVPKGSVSEVLAL